MDLAQGRMSHSESRKGGRRGENFLGSRYTSAGSACWEGNWLEKRQHSRARRNLSHCVFCCWFCILYHVSYSVVLMSHTLGWLNHGRREKQAGVGIVQLLLWERDSDVEESIQEGMKQGERRIEGTYRPLSPVSWIMHLRHPSSYGSIAESKLERRGRARGRTDSRFSHSRI